MLDYYFYRPLSINKRCNSRSCPLDRLLLTQFVIETFMCQCIGKNIQLKGEQEN